MAMSAQALVIGGGISGAATAAHLARAGRHVIVFERGAGPHDKVCGEFISDEAVRYLRDLDIDLEALGAVRIAAIRIYSRNNVVSARLPFPAFSVSRRALDEAVLRAASAAGAELRRGHAVRSLRSNGNGWTVEISDDNSETARDAFLATGKHELRGWKRPPGQQNDLIAFKLHWRLTAVQTAALGSFVELFLFPGGYAGLELVENGIANLCLVIGRSHFALLDNKWEFLLSALRADYLPFYQRLSGAKACWDRPLAMTSIPYGYVADRGNGPWRLGDQAAVIPSFSGNGISMALHSARLAAQYYLAGKNSADFQTNLARDFTGQVREATGLARFLVNPNGQAIAMAVARLAPTIVGHVARRTRISRRRLIGYEQQTKRQLLHRV
jgi:flavin-dependent dehydrogenase